MLSVFLSLLQVTVHVNHLYHALVSAPAVFQRAMDIIVKGIESLICYIDDILVTDTTDEEHLDRLEEVLMRLKEYGLRAKKNKCYFFQASVDYLGHQIDAVGLRTEIMHSWRKKR